MKNAKLILILVGVAVLGAVSLKVFLPAGEDSGREDRTFKSVKEKSGAAKARDRVRAKWGDGKKMSLREQVAVARQPPKFEIESADEEKLSVLQRKLLEEIRAALRDDDYKTLMRLVHKMQTSDEWPDGVPNSIKKAALEALGWYGSKCLAEIVPFLADSNPEIVADAVSQWEDAIAECDSDREISAQVKLASRVVVEADSVESILSEVMNMRHSVAVETFKDVLANGNEAAKAKVIEQIADYTDDSTITTVEQLDEWLEKNPDDPGDEEMYGSISDDAD